MALPKSLALVLAPPHRAGLPFIYGGAGVAVVGGLILGGWLFWLATLFTFFCLYFFRDPERVAPPRPDLAVAPADGRIVLVDQAPPPPELDMGAAPVWRVAIFLSVIDVHVNRSPVTGRVGRIAYRHGAFVDASLDKASENNERNALRLDLPDGRQVGVVQIAGLIARRIVCTVREGEPLLAGERFGIIRFGSRTDLYLPPGVVPLVAVGQTMIGGETVIAELAAQPRG
ncbi:MAG: phosphatidylserine decarboxylase [Rubritepida sp.]|jgi:phosphatidylserine decarboxylase|nr:phosphatidylserine decarboxylase [Rubritepida sp.]